MNFTPKTTLASFLAVAVLSLLLLGSPEPRTVIAQQPDYTAQCSNGIAVPNPQNNTGLVQDCAALLASKNTLDPAGEFNWSANTSIYEWDCLGFESTLQDGFFRGSIVSIICSGQNLGSLPPQLGDLPNLKRLFLPRTGLTGSIPPELGNLSNLWELNLRNNQLTGSIPPELGNLTRLSRLYLSGNQLTGCIPVALRDVSDHDFGSLGLPLCDTADTTPTPTPPPHPTATPPPPPVATSTPTATPTPPTVPDDVLNRLGVIESLLATLQGLISALESRIAALESDASRPTPTPAPVVPTPTPVQGEPTPTPVVPTPTPNDPCIDEVTNSDSKDGNWDEDCESVSSLRMLIDSGRGDGPHYALYYTFTLTAPANVTVTLDSDDQDTFLYLLAGKGANVGEIGALDMRHYNDDHGSHQDTDACANDGTLEEYDSCITKSLAAGDYTLEATTYNSRVTGSFTLTVSGIR